MPHPSEDLSVYSRPAIFFHWSIALLIGLAYLAIEMRGPKGTDSSIIWTNIHFLAGFLVFALSGFRVLWRLWHGAPPDSKDASAFLARLVHLMLYVFMFVQPLLGVLMENTGGSSVHLPLMHLDIALVGTDPIAHRAIRAVHEWLGNAFYWVIGLHALAAIGHHFVMKDETLRRMLGLQKRS